MTAEEESKIDWSLTTWKGSRLQQHREFHALSFRRKLEAIEELGELASHFLEQRKRKGLPYIDPDTRELVRWRRRRPRRPARCFQTAISAGLKSENDHHSRGTLPSRALEVRTWLRILNFEVTLFLVIDEALSTTPS